VIDAGSAGMIAEIASALPGVDEAVAFAQLMQQVNGMTYDVVVFDTAPTGHTLRLLSFPSVLEKAFEKFNAVKAKFGGLFAQISGMVQPDTEQKVLGKLEQAKKTIEAVNAQFKDPEQTTFVCVCISEFLSVYETERLVQELAKYEIDVRNIVVNQVLFPEDSAGSSGSSHACKKCLARRRMQAKYLEQIASLYEDFHVVYVPQLDDEVRGVAAITQFSEKLVQNAPAPPPPPKAQPAQQ
jgi:arsenite-transporting ATPase